MWMKVKRLYGEAKIPTRAHNTDAGLDVYCVENVVILAGKDHLIKTGISIAIPDGLVAVVKEKSGIATKKKVTVGACVIDSGYRGELMIHLFNNGNIPATFVMGEKIAQLVVVPCWTGQPEEVESLDETPRGDGGFGSTDVCDKMDNEFNNTTGKKFADDFGKGVVSGLRGLEDFLDLLGYKDLSEVSKRMLDLVDNDKFGETNIKNGVTTPVKLSRKTSTQESKEYWDTIDRVAKQTDSWSEEKKLDAQAWLNRNVRRETDAQNKPKIRFTEFSMNDCEPQCKYTQKYIKDCDCGGDGFCEFDMGDREEDAFEENERMLDLSDGGLKRGELNMLVSKSRQMGNTENMIKQVGKTNIKNGLTVSDIASDMQYALDNDTIISFDDQSQLKNGGRGDHLYDMYKSRVEKAQGEFGEANIKNGVTTPVKLSRKTDTPEEIKRVYEENKNRTLLPNGCMLYWKDNGVGGRIYTSDECGIDAFVWDTAVTDMSTLLMAMAQEEFLIKKEWHEANKNNK